MAGTIHNSKTNRPVTRAQRGFGASQLQELPRDDVRKLCHGLLLAGSASVTDFRSTAEFDEFALEANGFWRAHRMLFRIYHRPVGQSDVDDARSFAEATGALESLVLPVHGGTDLFVEPPVAIISADEIAERITSSTLVRWDEELPSVATDRVELMLRLANTALVDPVGIQWLPSLALNEVPTSLVEHCVEPQDLFERKAFRLLTSTFLFRGVRHGESERGKRLPDAVLDWPDGSPTSALLDCKSASSGYRMSADDVLRFIGYWENLSPSIQDEGQVLRYFIVLSSYFGGIPGDRHPYWSRAEEIQEKTGLQLVYLTASDLAWAAARLEIADVPLQKRRQLNWDRLLKKGLVNDEHFEDEVNEVIA